MSVEVSIKKQSVLGLILILIILISIEIGIRVYETFSLPCDFVNTDVFKNTDFSIKRDICLDATYLETTNDQITLHNPNQNFKTITIGSGSVNKVYIGEQNPLVFIGGPCAIESYDHSMFMAEKIQNNRKRSKTHQARKDPLLYSKDEMKLYPDWF